MTRPFLTGILLFGTLCSACGSPERPAQADSMMFDSHMANAVSRDRDEPVAEEASEEEFVDTLETGACDVEGEALDCKVWLPTMAETNNCFVGSQVCVAGEWSPCMTDEDALDMMGSQNGE